MSKIEDEFMNRYFDHHTFLDIDGVSDYMKKYPCPKCGSHSVTINLISSDKGCVHVRGSERCRSCGWHKEIDTFPKEESK
jgi:hypothetical protein